MIVYGVTEGSGCSFAAMFSTPELANRYIDNNGKQDMRIEEFTLDDIPDDNTPFWDVHVGDPTQPDLVVRDSWPNEESFAEMDRVYLDGRFQEHTWYWLRVKANDEATALKIARERVARHKAERAGIA